MKQIHLNALMKELGQRYSDILGLDLSEGKDQEVFKWFFASMLFGAPISEKSAIKTFNCFKKHGVIAPERILETGWDGLVRILDEGGYTRYDFKTADKLLAVMQRLLDRYHGSLTYLHNEASGARDLENRLKGLGKGIGDVTVGIFLRELRGTWEKADPYPSALVVLAAAKLGIIKGEPDAKTALGQLKHFWSRNRVEGKSFVDFETALVRFGKDLRRKQLRLAPSR